MAKRPEDTPVALRKEVIERDGKSCRKCFCKPSLLHIHHIVPVENGGEAIIDNLITLCPTCHAECHAVELLSIDIEEWLTYPTLKEFVCIWLSLERQIEPGLTVKEWHRTSKTAIEITRTWNSKGAACGGD